MKNANQRNIGIDALRIFSMFMIVLMHVLKQGGILYSFAEGTLEYDVLWLIEIVAFCSVDCYALISGYVGYESKFRFSRLLTLWLQVAFYTILITLLFNVVSPQNTNLHIWTKALFPIMFRQYWYVTCYFGLLLVMPIINAGLQGMEEKQLGKVVLIAVCFFSVLPCVLQGYPVNLNGEADVFGALNGYSTIWLLILYCVGAYLKKSRLEERIKGWKLGIVLLVDIIVTWVWLLGMPGYTMKRFGEVRYAFMFINYTSPAMLLMAVCFLLLFARQNWKAKFGKIVTKLSSATLGVYLIHTHPLIWDALLKDVSARFKSDMLLLMVGKILLLTVGIYLICMCIDLLRGLLFHLLKVNNICGRLLDKE